jgi:hypothetical protein
VAAVVIKTIEKVTLAQRKCKRWLAPSFMNQGF